MKKIWLIVVGIFLALIAGEVYLRFNSAAGNFYVESTPYEYSCFKKGTYYWIGFVPGSDCILQSPGGAFPDVEIKVNSLGLRSTELPDTKTDNEKRILFVGDSFTAGWGVVQDKIWPEVVGASLSAARPWESWKVLNAGMVAAGPNYYYLYLKNEITRLKPDVVVVGFYIYNDVENVLDSKEVFGKDNLPTRATSTLYQVTDDGRLSSTDVPLAVEHTWMNNSYLMRFVGDWYFTKFKQKSKPGFVPKICFFKGMKTDECVAMNQANEKTQVLFSAMKQLVEASGAKFEVVMIPAEVQVRNGVKLKYGIVIPLSPTDKARPNKDYADFFNGEGIDYLDLLPTFIKWQGVNPYYVKDDHWNDLGHKIAGEAVAKKIIDELN